jgi:FHA domain
MSECTICGTKIPDGSRTCSICGSSADEIMPSAMALHSAASIAASPTELPAGGSYCPVCARVYGPDHLDPFCTCGTELSKELQGELPMAPILDDAPPDDSSAMKVRCAKPPSETPCLVLYGPDKEPLQYFALTKDAMLIGRLDAVAGHFPDIDLDEWFDRATIRKISRQHALILRTRATNTFALRPLAGNTGTQLDTQLVTPLQDYPLKPGHRIILGGVIRLKFEIA